MENMDEKTRVINGLVDAARSSTGSTTDYKLAQALEIPTQRISDYRSGKRIPDAYACTRLAQALKRDPLEIIAMVEANSAKNEAQRAFWRSYKFFGTPNTFGWLLCGTLAFLGAGLSSGNAEANTIAISHNGGLRKSQRRRYHRRNIGRRADDRLAA